MNFTIEALRERFSKFAETLGFTPLSLLIISCLLLVIVIALLFLLLIVPARKRKGIRKADKILRKDQRDQFDKAISMLVEAIQKGVGKNGIRYATYLLAYAYTKKGEYKKAQVRLGEMDAKSQKDPDILYLSFYVAVQLEEYRDAITLYASNQALLNHKADANKMAAYAYLCVAVELWNNNEVAGAFDYFDKVRNLGEYCDKLPAGATNHLSMLGLRALHNGNTLKAREHFMEIISNERADERSRMEAKLGICLCTWVEEEQPDIEQELSEIVRYAEKSYQKELSKTPRYVRCEHCKAIYRINTGIDMEKYICSECGKSFDPKEITTLNQAEKNGAKQIFSQGGILLINTLLLYSQSYLFSLMAKNLHSGITREMKQTYIGRLDNVLKVDRDEPLARIAKALFLYFTAEDLAEKDEAVNQLEAVKEIEYSEILNIIQEKKARNEREKNILNEYLELVKDYVSNSDVPLEYRESLYEKLNQNPAFAKWATRKHLAVDHNRTEPSLTLLSIRNMLVKSRVENFIHTKRASKTGITFNEAEITQSLQKIEEGTKIIREQATAMEKDENRVLSLTGELLLQEDETLNTEEQPEPDGGAEAAQEK